MQKQFQAPASPSPHPERKFGSPHPGLAGRRQRPARADEATQVAQPLRPPSPAARGDPHPSSTWTSRSSPGARSWLGGGSGRRGSGTRSWCPRRPRTARRQLPGNFLAGEAAATSPARLCVPRAAARAPSAALPAAAAPPAHSGRAVTWPGRPPSQAGQEAPPPETPPPARPSAAVPGRGGRGHPGASGRGLCGTPAAPGGGHRAPRAASVRSSGPRVNRAGAGVGFLRQALGGWK